LALDFLTVAAASAVPTDIRARLRSAAAKVFNGGPQQQGGSVSAAKNTDKIRT
jgi:hypothetical protein